MCVTFKSFEGYERWRDTFIKHVKRVSNKGASQTASMLFTCTKSVFLTTRPILNCFCQLWFSTYMHSVKGGG